MTQDEMREVLRTALRDAHGTSVDDVEGLPFKYPLTLMPDALAEALLPVVRKIAADELRKAASNVRHAVPGYIGRIDTADSIDDRADNVSAS